MQFRRSFSIFCISFIHVLYLTAAYGSSGSSLPGNAPVKIPPVVYPPKPAQAPTVKPPPPLPRPVVPPMEKPFGMPGVVGLHDGKWEGTDYLGHLSKNISIDIEVLKGDKSPVNVDTSSLNSAISTLLKNEGLIPHAVVKEGPPLPFLHILVIIYPIEKDKFVVFTTCRLFEEIQVVRKDFKPAGHWQAITWENQDILVSTFEQLPAQVKSSTEALVKAFIERYHLYNKENIDEPGKVIPQST